MFAHRSFSATICLRCQLQLTRQLKQSSIRPSPSANFTSTIVASSVEDSKHSGPKITFHDVEPKPSHPDYKERVLHFRSKLRRRYGEDIWGGEERLAINSLGAPSDIIVLRKPHNKRNKKLAKWKENVASRKAVLKNLLVDDEGKKGAPTPDDIYQWIESLRPSSSAHQLTDKTALTQEEYETKARALQEGFLNTQLRHYYEVWRARSEKASLHKGASKKRGPRKGSPVASSGLDHGTFTRSIWKAGTTKIDVRLPVLEESQFVKPKTYSKKHLTQWIMRDHWRIVVLDDIEKDGELELTLASSQLKLLTAGGSSTLLDQIGQQRNAKIEIYWPANVLRITADMITAEYVARDISERLQYVQIAEFDLTPFKNLPPWRTSPSSLDLQMVAELSRTLIDKPDDNKFLIRGISKNNVEDAHRQLLLTLIDVDTYGKIIRNISNSAIASARNTVLQPIKTLNYLPLSQKGIGWSRRVIPTPRGAASPVATMFEQRDSEFKEAESSTALHNKLLPDIDGWVTSFKGEATKKSTFQKLRHAVIHSVSTSDISLERSNTNATKSYWRLDMVQSRFSTQLGQLLYYRKTTSRAPNTKKTSNTEQKNKFINLVPGFSQFLSRTLGLSSKCHEETEINFRLLPSPWTKAGLSALEDMPEVILKLQLASPSPYVKPGDDSEFEQVLGSLRMNAIIHEHIYDMDLPHRVVDFRLHQTIEIETGDSLINDPSVAAFVRNVVKSNQDWGDIQASPTVQIQIPTSFVRHSVPKYTTDSTLQSDIDDHLSVPYTVVDILHKDKVDTSYNGFPLIYSGVLSRSLAGRWDELQLQGNRSQLEQYVDSLLKLVDEIHDCTISQIPLKSHIRKNFSGNIGDG